MPQLVPNQFSIKSDTKTTRSEVLAVAIQPDSPAQKAGLKNDDQLVKIGLPGHLEAITSDEGLSALAKKYAGQKVDLIYYDQGRQHISFVKLNSQQVVTASLKTNNQKYYLGVQLGSYTLKRSTWSAPIVAVGLTAQLSALTYQGVGHALGGLGSIIAGTVTGNSKARTNGQSAASSQVAGPVGIFAVMQDGSLLGYQFMLMIIAIISLTLALMNILPIPALDGGRLWITLIAHALKKPLSAKKEEAINAAGFVVLMALIVVVTIVDIHRFY
jgi:regulator of sigma E protease